MTTTTSLRKTSTPTPLWVGAGKTGEWNNVGEALFDSELDFPVEQVNAWDDRNNIVPGIMVNRRTDTGEILGVTSDQYGIVSNEQAFSLLDPFCKAGGTIEHAGMTIAGMCFMVMRMPSMDLSFMDDDFEMYVCAMNSFNTKFPLAIIITPLRVICQNMFRKLMQRGDTALLIKHGKFAADRILSVSAAATLLFDYRNEMNDELCLNAGTVRGYGRVEEFVNKMFPKVEETPNRPRAKFTNERIDALRQHFIEDYYYAPDNLVYEGSRLGILNAYYDWVTHHVPTRASAFYDELQFGRMLNGEAVNRKLLRFA